MRRPALCCLLIVTFAVLGANALTLVRISDAEIVQNSERIFLATVSSTQVEWKDPDGDGTRNIYTVATLRLEKVVKGDVKPGEDVTLHMFGGTMDGLTQEAPGLPVCAKGERLLLCIRANADTCKFTPITGAVQGRWVVSTDQDGVDWAARTIGDAQLFDRTADGNLAPSENKPEGPEKLTDLMARLQKEVR